MKDILQGTTPTLNITLPVEISVDEITALELTLKQKNDLRILQLADVQVNSETNSISYTFTEAQTLALVPAVPLIWQMRVQTPDGIFGTPQSKINVQNLISQESLS